MRSPGGPGPVKEEIVQGNAMKRRVAIGHDLQAMKREAGIGVGKYASTATRVRACEVCGAPVVDSDRARAAHLARMPGCRK